MGQRHQMFIIAKVGGGARQRYRCVAAFHWQWLYGQGPARAASRFIRAVKPSINALLIRADLDTFDDYSLKHTVMKIDEQDVFAPCPYVTLLFRAATCVGVDDGFIGGNGFEILDATISTCETDNNDGITIFDISDPTNPRYCMVAHHDLEGEIPFKDTSVPLSGRDYVEHYYPYINPSLGYPIPEGIGKNAVNEIKTAFEQLETTPLIDRETLEEAFPEDYSSGRYLGQETGSESETSNASTDEICPVPSLSTITARILVQNIVSTPERYAGSIEGLLQVGLDSSMLALLRTDLATYSKLPDCILPFLGRILLLESNPRGYVDLTPFSLQSGQLLGLVPFLSSCEILKLANTTFLPYEELNAAISGIPHLKTLILFHHGVRSQYVCKIHSDDRPNRLQIAHKSSCFRFLRGDVHPSDLTYRAPEFSFLLHGSESSRGFTGRRLKEAASLVKIDDLNFVMQALCDAVSLLFYESYSYSRAVELPRICFGSQPRSYGSAFASAGLADLAPWARYAAKWSFFLEAQGSWGTHWTYAFIRHSNRDRIYDLDGFIRAVQTRRPELPPVTGFLTKRDDVEKDASEFDSFYKTLSWLLKGTEETGDGACPFIGGRKLRRRPCKLATPSEACSGVREFFFSRR